MKKYKIGYTQGTFDMFHIGHLNLLERAKQLCDFLIVGINSDDLVKSYKKKTPIINETDRCRIVSSLKVVNDAAIVTTLDKMDALAKFKFNVIFIGDDWINNQRWIDTKKELNLVGVDVVFLPHTDGISSTLLMDKIQKTSK